MAAPHGSLAGAAARRRLGSLACQLVQPTSVAEAALPPPGGAVNPELARRGVTEYSCFDIPAGATVDELMQQRGAQDIDPETAATVEPIFDMNADCIRNFDHDKFQRDGYWVWDKIWLPEAQEKLVAACHRAQKLVDMYTEGYKELGEDVLSGVPNPDAQHVRTCTHPSPNPGKQLDRPQAVAGSLAADRGLPHPAIFHPLFLPTRLFCRSISDGSTSTGRVLA
jgi:hypothetical protein